MDLAKNMDSEGNSDGPVVFVIDSVTFTASFYGWFFPFLTNLFYQGKKNLIPATTFSLSFS